MTQSHTSDQPGRPNDPLEPHRLRIDELDEQIVKLLNERAQHVIEIGKLKRNGSSAIPIYAPDREARVLEHLRRINEGPLPDTCLEAMWRELMSGSFALERPLRIAYLGPRGSFSHLAATRQFGSCVEYVAQDDIANVFHAVERDETDLGLVPIENSTGGGITETHDSFLESSALVCAEVLIPIHHNLLSRIPEDQITRIYSKPEIFTQCRRWLSNHFTQAQRIGAPSSAKAAEMAASEPGAAAIGSTLAAELYNLEVRAANIEDNSNNVTRFFVIGKQRPAPTGDDKTAIMFTTAHRSGTLSEVLDIFREHQINLTHIDKRPSKRVNWEYYFFIDCEGHQEDPNVQQAIDVASTHCLHLTVLGSFPRARQPLG